MLEAWFNQARGLVMDNMMVIIGFIAGVFAAPTVSDLLDRIRGN